MNKLRRSITDKWFTGLCGGLAAFLGINATVIRILMVIAAFCSFGTTLLAYFIASWIIPKDSYMSYL
ncbi:PspC domain-containing protein [Paenibacillus hexagrammi]|uniref:PspC domain-containing protein n=1 Tax=Paenibacillus hexagrammi TaxID=2908839 RepID=A0ABY3SHT2_9BACL|nr:PspC domain-containing protein [Paenibacillus sp. YPD9-1]UJF33584.1 PspC domain-containing protein [Paenibacillus sp. YPD9-1]